MARPSGRVFYASLPALLFAGVLLAAYVVLSPALQGGFLFDDEPNLSDLGAYGGVVDWASFKAYVLSGFSGPTGRPLAMMSFLIDDYTWPSAPYAFKRTNLLLHLLNYAALVWASLNLGRLFRLSEQRAAWLAVLNASLWVLHPLLISTTFYVVQRMAMLAATFSFLALAAYLHGRRLWPERPRRALIWMSASITLGTLTATFSKENGALLPLLIGVVEFCLPTHLPRLPRWFITVFVVFPSLAVLAYLLSQWNPAPHPWPQRSFNQIERLLTEARILWDYLGWWYWPRIEDAGLFRDAIEVSRSLWQPLTTLPAVLGILALPIVAAAVRRKVPWFSLAILFFLAGHLLESTLIGLELYFEHRNYLPSAFLSLPLVALAVATPAIHQQRLLRFALAAFGVMLAFMTHQRALLWADPIQLESYWALAAPDSPRGANALARHLIERAGDIDRARKVLDEGLQKHPDNGLLVLTRLQLDINLGQANAEAFQIAAQRLKTAPFDAQTVMALRHVTESTLKQSAPAEYRANMHGLINALASNAHYRDLPLFTRLIPYLRARLALRDGMADEAYTQYRQAMAHYGNINSAMEMVAEMGNANYPEHALRLLDEAEALLRRQADGTLTFDRATYAFEIRRIRRLLDEERKKQINGDSSKK